MLDLAKKPALRALPRSAETLVLPRVTWQSKGMGEKYLPHDTACSIPKGNKYTFLVHALSWQKWKRDLGKVLPQQQENLTSSTTELQKEGLASDGAEEFLLVKM